MGKGAQSKARRQVLPEAPPAAARAGRPATAPADAILPRILEPLRTGQGIRVGWLGNTGKGKSYAAAWFIEQLRRGGFVHVVLTVDDKDRATVYPGTQRVNPADLRSRPPGEGEDPTSVVYRGVILDPGRTVDVDEVCRQAWELAGMPGGPKVLVAIGELRRAVSPAGREWRAPAAARTLAEGRGPGISLSWETQSPQRIPVEGFDNSILCVFGLGHRGRAYLERADLIGAEVSAVVAGLPERQFVVIDDAGDWDGVIYEIPFRRS
jgi:hypothetical protein